MDLLRADRDVASAVADLRRGEVDWDAYRHVAGRRGLREILDQSESPLRDALATWVTWLAVARVAEPSQTRLAAARAEPSAVVRLEREERLSFDAIRAGLLCARAPGEARAHFSAMPEAASRVREPARTLREVRTEALRQLEVSDAGARFLGTPASDLAGRARDFLEATADLAREQTRRSEWPLDLDVRLARTALEGWPSRLGWRSAAGLLPGLAMRATAPGEPPRALGAASFARALEAIGLAFHRSLANASTPFVLREGPLGPGAARTALVFASPLGERAFHARVLGLGAGRAKDQARALRAAFLLDARFAALRVALRSRGDFDGLTHLALGAPLPEALEEVFPEIRDEDLARFLALLGAPDLVATLRDREGDDWFRNPRAFATLRDLVQTPPELADDAAGRLARALEESLA